MGYPRTMHAVLVVDCNALLPGRLWRSCSATNIFRVWMYYYIMRQCSLNPANERSHVLDALLHATHTHSLTLTLSLSLSFSHTHTVTYTRVRTHTRARVRAHTHTHTLTHTRAHARTHAHVLAHGLKHARKQAQLRRVAHLSLTLT